MPATSTPHRNGADPAAPATIALAPLAPFWAMASTQMVAAQRLAIGHWRLAFTANRAMMDAWRGVLRAQQNAVLAIDTPPLEALVANDAADVREAVAAVHDASLSLLQAQADASERLRKSA